LFSAEKTISHRFVVENGNNVFMVFFCNYWILGINEVNFNLNVWSDQNSKSCSCSTNPRWDNAFDVTTEELRIELYSSIDKAGKYLLFFFLTL